MSKNLSLPPRSLPLVTLLDAVHDHEDDDGDEAEPDEPQHRPLGVRVATPPLLLPLLGSGGFAASGRREALLHRAVQRRTDTVLL